ncbi:hypothetical protein BDV36DRAFT_310246 [Aspergillus pseudocaelatus]|uniref:Xylanolytic transcriptional activator regulatory domain-containing protein n=1 Tax=Aspergillus pseudocaelatus TaxID=1825620 RepID=A0ABQ6WGH3_9EURO|nr:hypothetical protein BDV36DRAFT_310246 [Aspergillus pseudocaelatus]
MEPGLPPVDELHRLTKLFFKTSRLMLLYLITTLGTMAGPAGSEQHLNTYLGYCHTLVGHLILQPSIESVQALLLFSITLRLRDQLSQAWDVLTLAISISQTLRPAHLSAPLRTIHDMASDSDKNPMRTWWALYVFEKFLAFDSGRQSTLDDPRLSSVGRQHPTDPMNNGKMLVLQDYEEFLTSLANVLREMQHRSWHTWRTESLDTTSDADARASKIRTAGAIDTLLWEWRISLPSEYQIIVLNRNTLLLDWSEVKKEVDRYGSGEPWHLRLRNGPQICLEAAKDMTNLQVMVTEAGEPSFLALGTSPLAAAYVLAVHIRLQPASILSRAHSELMKAAMAISRQRYSSSTTQNSLHKSLDALERYVSQLLGDIAVQSSVEFNTDPGENSVTTMTITDPALSNPLEPPPLSWGSFDLLSWDWNELVPQA